MYGHGRRERESGREYVVDARAVHTGGVDWTGELDLGIHESWPRMGTRSLGEHRWLIVDEHLDAELDLRARLLRERRSEVLAEPPPAAAATEELEAMVAAAGVGIASGSTPLERLGRSVQEDFCLLSRGTDEWVLDAAVLCFPSRWRLADKLGRPLTEVHGPVPRYAPTLAERVTTMLDRLGERTVLRRNWFVHPDPSLFQPLRPPGGDPVVPATDCGSGLFLRSERQTLRRLPSTGWVVFTIRIQQCTLGDLAMARPADLRTFVCDGSADLQRHKGMAVQQVDEVRRWLSGSTVPT